MNAYKDTAKKYLARFTKPARKNMKLTQDKIAEKLRITSRSYGALERGEGGFSTPTLLLFLGLLSDDEILDVVKGFQKEVDRAENSGAE
jgi:transcriptional regulator with XRE-family HTH domain